MSGLIWIQTFDILIVFQKELLKKVNFEKVSRRQQKHVKLPSMQEVPYGDTSQRAGSHESCHMLVSLTPPLVLHWFSHDGHVSM